MQKISIKREQSQAGLSFAERENRRSLAGGESKFRPQVKNKLLLLLVLLMTAATGAWADTTVTWTSSDMPGIDIDFIDGSAKNNTIKGITATASTGGDGNWAGDCIASGDGDNTITFTSSVGNIKSIEIKAGSINISSNPPGGWTISDTYQKLSWSGEASSSVSLTFSSWEGITMISEIVFTIAPTGYNIKLDEGTGNKDSQNWEIKPQSSELSGGEAVTVKYNGSREVKSVTVVKKVVIPDPIALSAVTADNIGSVVTSDGNVYPAKTPVLAGKTAVGILGKVTSTGHGLILALKDAAQQNWNTINGWTSVNNYAGTTLKRLPNAAHGTNLTSYTTLGETAVSNWAVAQKSDYDAIFTNLGSKTGDSDGTTYDANVNAYITTGVGGTALSGEYWSATMVNGDLAWDFTGSWWHYQGFKDESRSVRPVLGF